MEERLINFSGKLTTVINPAINHLHLKPNEKIEGILS